MNLVRDEGDEAQALLHMVHNPHVAGCEEEDVEGVIVEKGQCVTFPFPFSSFDDIVWGKWVMSVYEKAIIGRWQPWHFKDDFTYAFGECNGRMMMQALTGRNW
ncbi:hypothetical protein F5I97DRAFT_1830720 [Phlebopus sp. FC_14]|nr:hypothetical protein F5I97DRAFT_1830720 [Phlebopus sp. FC_14]